MGFCIRVFGNALPHERKSRLGGGGFLTFAYSRHRFRRREVCLGQGGLSLSCKAQRSLQVIYFSLLGPLLGPFLGGSLLLGK